MALKSLRGTLQTLGQSTFDFETFGLVDGGDIIPDDIGGARREAQLVKLYNINFAAMMAVIVKVINGQS